MLDLYEEQILREVILRIVLLENIKAKDLKNLKMDIESESCSVCLENLSVSSKPTGVITRMPCSHVFHNHCVLKWLYRKNTCPLCRTVLYDR